MEIIRKNNPVLAVLGVAAFVLGIVLLAGAMWMLPDVPAGGLPSTFLIAVLAFLPISIGGWTLGTFITRRDGRSVEYGQDEPAGGIIFALWVIIAGAMLLGFNSGALPVEWRRVFFSWQMLLLAGSMNELARGRFVFGTILLAVGGFFMLRRLEPLYPDIEAMGIDITFWPVLLIVGGILILGGLVCRPLCGRCGSRSCGTTCGKVADKPSGGSSRVSGVVDITAVFGGSEQVYFDHEFRGGKISTLFGGVKLDLRRTHLPEGITYLRIESVFGGVEIDAPEEWLIEIRNESVFGGFSDKRLPAVGADYDSGRKLVIRASCVFGGGEIK